MIMDPEQIVEQIRELKKERNAVIVAHTYQRAEVQEIADKTGDSYALSRFVSQAKEDVIVFCGVHFMAESAKILSPSKTVLLPALNAGCPMANMVTGEDVRMMKEKYPGAAVACYINSTAEVKAESDVCVTSSNAVKVISSMEEKDIIFVPDRNLGMYIAQQIPEKNILLWDGYCIVHEALKEEDVVKWKELKPDALLLAHPECNQGVLVHADFIGSTKAIIDYVIKEKSKKEFIIATEKGVAHPIKKERPDVDLYFPSPCLLCVNMKKTGINDVYNALNDMQHEILLSEEIIKKARRCLDRMLELS